MGGSAIISHYDHLLVVITRYDGTFLFDPQYLFGTLPHHHVCCPTFVVDYVYTTHFYVLRLRLSFALPLLRSGSVAFTLLRYDPSFVLRCCSFYAFYVLRVLRIFAFVLLRLLHLPLIVVHAFYHIYLTPVDLSHSVVPTYLPPSPHTHTFYLSGDCSRSFDFHVCSPFVVPFVTLWVGGWWISLRLLLLQLTLGTFSVTFCTFVVTFHFTFTVEPFLLHILLLYLMGVFGMNLHLLFIP